MWFVRSYNQKCDLRVRARRKRHLTLERFEPRYLMATNLDYRQEPLNAEGEVSGIVTWGIALDGTQTKVEGKAAQGSGLMSTLNSLYGTKEKWLKIFQAAFDAWDDVSAVKFVYEPNDDMGPSPSSPPKAGVRADIRIAGVPIDGGGGILAEAHSDRDIVIDTDFGSGDGFLKQLYIVTLHEIGHILGLNHIYVARMASSENKDRATLTSIMQPAIDQITGVDLQYDDILQVQKLLGDGYEPNNVLSEAVPLGISVVGTTIVDKLSIKNKDDEDFFEFDMTKGQSLTVRVTPDGNTYLRGTALNALTPFDALRQNRLSLEIRDEANIDTRIVPAQPLGQSVQIDSFAVAKSGKYFIRVRGEGAETQRYRMTIEVGNTPEFDPRNPVGVAAVDKLRADVATATNQNVETTINLSRGTYRLNQVLQITGNVTIIGQGSGNTVLDAQRMSRIFALSEGATLTLKGVTLTHGVILGEFETGGAIYSHMGKVVLDDVMLLDNQATNKGGAIRVSQGELHMNKVVAMYNHAGDGSSNINGSVYGEGGAVYVLNSIVNIQNSRFTDNMADNSGGALVASGGSIDITTSQFTHNRAVGGPGGLSVSSGDGNREARISDTWITNNSAEYGGGLGLGRGHANLKLLRIEGNHAQFSGGGIRVSDQGSFALEDSLVSNNTANDSAGINVSRDLTKPMPRESLIRNSWIRGNTAVYTGGGLGVISALRIDSSTISENSAAQWYGGGISAPFGARLLIINSTISLNKANNSGAGVAIFSESEEKPGEINLVHTTVAANTLSAVYTNQGAGGLDL